MGRLLIGIVNLIFNNLHFVFFCDNIDAYVSYCFPFPIKKVSLKIDYDQQFLLS